MINNKEVFYLLAGESRPANSVASSNALQKLAATQHQVRDDRVVRSVFRELSDVDASDVATIIRATAIALPGSCIEIPNLAYSETDRLSSPPHSRFSTENYNTGFLVGWIEAGVWLQERGQLDAHGKVIFPTGLAKFCIEAWNYRYTFAELDDNLSGRLSNVSGRFIFNFDQHLMFERFLRMSTHSFQHIFGGGASECGAQQVVSELTIKAIINLSTRDRLYMIAANSVGIKVTPHIETFDTALARTVVGTGP